MSRRRRPDSAHTEPTAGTVLEHDANSDAPLADALADLAPGTLIVVSRLSPSHAKGYLETVTLPEGGALELVDMVKASWGGGTFTLQPRRRNVANGRTQFAGGGRQITIAGPPLYHGTPYGPDGRVASAIAPAPAPAPAPVVMAPASGALEGRLLQILERFIPAAAAGKGSMSDLAELGRVINEARASVMPAIAAAPSVDVMAEMERQVQMFARLRKLFGERDYEEAPAAPSDPMQQIMMAFLSRQMGGDPSMMMGRPMMPPPPQPQSQSQVVHEPPPQPQPNPAPRPAATVDEDAPLSADEIADELDELEPSERAKILGEVFQRQPDSVREALLEQLGLTPEKLDAMFGQMAASGGLLTPKFGAGQ